MSRFLLGSILPAKQWHGRRLWISLSGCVVLAALLAFLNVGRWLVIEEPLQKASAIAVLSGRMPSRALEAARVYKQGYASRVWLTYSREPGDTLAKLSIPYIGEDSYDKQILMKEGVPESAIQVLEPPIMNTADEMRAIGEELRKEKQGKVIIVTSKVHTRRTRALWNRLAPHDGAAIVHAVSDDPFDSAHWWRNTSDALDVVREILGLLNAWLGLPLRPAAYVACRISEEDEPLALLWNRIRRNLWYVR
ncbi:MAG TPA: YdcF family protein [Candidatus Limnocylindrales bacterium]|nr:YdcF family protein [Candidatus Limnocylindrales bacterium]